MFLHGWLYLYWDCFVEKRFLKTIVIGFHRSKTKFRCDFHPFTRLWTTFKNIKVGKKCCWDIILIIPVPLGSGIVKWTQTDCPLSQLAVSVAQWSKCNSCLSFYYRTLSFMMKLSFPRVTGLFLLDLARQSLSISFWRIQARLSLVQMKKGFFSKSKHEIINRWDWAGRDITQELWDAPKHSTATLTICQNPTKSQKRWGNQILRDFSHCWWKWGLRELSVFTNNF